MVIWDFEVAISTNKVLISSALIILVKQITHFYCSKAQRFCGNLPQISGSIPNSSHTYFAPHDKKSS